MMVCVGALREKRQRAEGLLWHPEQLDAASQGPGPPGMSMYSYRPKVNTAALEVEQMSSSSVAELGKV